MHDPDESLDLLLSEWRVRGDVPASLQREVWASVAAGAADPGWWDSLLLALLRPRVLSLAAAAAVAVGVGWALLEPPPPPLSPHDAYVQSVSPFASVHLAAHR